jgi:membrane-bound lytic murein transglycosylase B
MLGLARSTLVALAAAALIGAAAARPAREASVGSGYAQRADVREFVDEMAGEGFRRSELLQLFAQVQTQGSALRAIDTRSCRRRSGSSTRPPLLSQARIDGGVRVLECQPPMRSSGPSASMACRRRSSWRSSASKRSNGRVSGRYRVIDALTTLAFDYPRRAEFFREELKQFLCG